MLIMCLALNIYFEATMNHELDRIAVSHVVVTRVNSPRWPSNACDVISEPSKDSSRPKACAFSWTCDGKPDIVKDSDKAAFSKIYELATEIYYGERHYDPTFGADHYIVCGTPTDWHESMELTVQIGKHCFYK